jgi:hypothetical protein
MRWMQELKSVEHEVPIRVEYFSHVEIDASII